MEGGVAVRHIEDVASNASRSLQIFLIPIGSAKKWEYHHSSMS